MILKNVEKDLKKFTFCDLIGPGKNIDKNEVAFVALRTLYKLF